MSHKRFYCKFNDNTMSYDIIGIPYDDGLPNEPSWIGPFRTKRGATFMAEQGVLIGSVEEMEALAKEAEKTPSKSVGVVEKLITTGEITELPISLLSPKTVSSITAPFCDDLPKEARSSYLTKLVHAMMD